MKICIASDFNIHDYPATLTRAFNDHTEHEAKCIIFYDDGIQYEAGKAKPVTLTPKGRQKATPAAEREAHDIVKWADFFIIGRRPLNFGSEETAIDFNAFLNPKNTIFLHWGSILRNNKIQLHGMYEKQGYTVIASPDKTILHGAGEMMYHFPMPYDGKLSAVEQDVETVKICHKPCNAATKGTDFLRYVIERLSKDTSVELVVVEGEKHSKCLDLVGDCQICVDEIAERGCYHSATLEAMAMGQVAVCSLSPFFVSLYPNCPVMNIDRSNAEETLAVLVANVESRKSFVKAQGEWLKKIHDPETVIRRFEQTIEVVAK